jgi:hypothetical protein
MKFSPTRQIVGRVRQGSQCNRVVLYDATPLCGRCFLVLIAMIYYAEIYAEKKTARPKCQTAEVFENPFRGHIHFPRGVFFGGFF